MSFFFFFIPRFSINSRKVLLKYSARNSSEERKGEKEVRNFFFFFRGTSGRGNSGNGDEFRDGRKFWPKNFREICALLRDDKTQIQIRINPLYRSIQSYIQSLTRWRLHKRKHNGGRISRIFFLQTTHFKRRTSTLYTFFLLIPAFFRTIFLPVLVGKPAVIARDKSYFSPRFINTPFSPRSLLFHLIIHLRFCYIVA